MYNAYMPIDRVAPTRLVASPSSLSHGEKAKRKKPLGHHPRLSLPRSRWGARDPVPPSSCHVALWSHYVYIGIATTSRVATLELRERKRYLVISRMPVNKQVIIDAIKSKAYLISFLISLLIFKHFISNYIVERKRFILTGLYEALVKFPIPTLKT